MEISARNGLWDERGGINGGLDLSTNNDPPLKDDVFKAFLSTCLKPATA
jgi:hypothetical protein